MTNLHVLPESRQKHEVKVDLDERAFLFPSGKPLMQLIFTAEGRRIHIDGLYPFNQARTPPRIFTLDLTDAKEFGLRLVEAVHTARTQLVVSDGVHIAINVVPNGYRFQFGDMNQPLELFIGTASIWRVCHSLLRAIDTIAPVESN
jgi:hypothetical protein